MEAGTKDPVAPIETIMKSTPKSESAKWSPLPKQCYNSVAISADGSRVVGGTFFVNKAATPSAPTNVGLFVWDYPAKNELLTGNKFAAIAPATNPPKIKWTRAGFLSVAISDDGKWAAGAGFISSGEGIICAFNVDTGAIMRDYRPPASANTVAISGDGNYLVGGADQLYVFHRKSSTAWSAPLTLAISDASGTQQTIERVDISDDGQWIAAAADNGWVALVKNPIGTSNPLHLVGTLQLPMFAQDVAVAGDGSGFAASGADGFLYYFDIAANSSSGSTTLAALWPSPWQLPNCKTCRWVDVSTDGSRLVTVGSEKDASGNLTGRGLVFMLSNSGGSANPVWPAMPISTTKHGPNCVSMDSAYAYVATADGSPPKSGGTPKGGFALFNGSNGVFSWRYDTAQVCYSVAVSADGSAAVGGSDDGHVYYFTLP